MENYINEVNRNVLYKVTIKYKGTDKIPTGILIEAKSIDGELNICQFCYNVEKNINRRCLTNVKKIIIKIRKVIDILIL